MCLIKVISYNRRTEIRFSRGVKGDFDQYIKSAMQEMRIRNVNVLFYGDTDFRADYSICRRLRKPDAEKLRETLYKLAEIPFEEMPKIKPKHNPNKPAPIHKVKNGKKITGFEGNLIFGRLKFFYA